MSEYNKSIIEVTNQMRLVEMALADEEKMFMSLQSNHLKELSERRILDYEQHLKNLTNQLECIEREIG